jgi:Family of unknown function (DUF6580)
MVTGIVLVTLAIACRLLTPALHIWNFAPVGAVALYAGARLPRRWAWAIPLAAMVLSDMVLDRGHSRPVLELARWTVYATLAATTWLGLFARRPRIRPWMLCGLSVTGSFLFFATTNFATWAEGQEYPLTGAGLVLCYVTGLAFLQSTITGNLFGTAVLFGIGPIVERAADRVWPRAAGNEAKTSNLGEVA